MNINLACRGTFKIPVFRPITCTINGVNQLHSQAVRPANALSLTTYGPPPPTPTPVVGSVEERLERRRKQSELLQQGKALRAAESKPKCGLKKRFWNEVRVVEVEDGLQIHLDTRPVRDSSKKILTIPKSKPLLAASIALEWDQLTSTQQALKQHLVPMTSIVSRAQDLEEDILNGNTKGRDEIVTMLMRYLNTDTLLCWAPAPKNVESSTRSKDSDQTKLHSLRDIQIATAKPILDFLTTFIWPGVQFEPVTEADTIIPTSQPEATKAIVRGWITGLPPCELAALERAVLAGKGLLGAVRLVVEWSPHWRHLQVDRDRKEPRFGVEEAARAASLEVTWQTDLWGEVEDSHDVDKEDLRRQLGSVVLLLSTVNVDR